MAIKFDVRFSDNVADLKKHLAEGLDQIEVTKAGMDKLVKSIGGENVIRAAHNYAAALHQIGGEAGALATIEKLTSAERARGIALIEKAIQKYEVLGREAPAALKDILNETKKVADANGELPKSLEKTQSGLTSLFTNLKGIAAVTGIGFGAAQVISFGKAIIADADALQKMSDRTGISAQWLQKFQVAGDEAGNTVEELTGAVNKMQDRLAGGDKSASAALEKIGLSLEQLKGLRPEDQFVAIADAIRKIEDPAEQVNVAIDLFGKGGAEILPTLKRGFDDLKDTTVGMSDETVKALDRIGDEWEALKRRMKGFTAEIVVSLIAPSKSPTASGVTASGADTTGAFANERDRLEEMLRQQRAEEEKSIQDTITRTIGNEPFRPKGLPTIALPDKVAMDDIDAALQKSIKHNEELARLDKERKQAQENIARIIKQQQEDGRRQEEQSAKLLADVKRIEERDALGFQAKLAFNNTDIEQARQRLELTKKIQDTIERTTFTSVFGKVGVNEDLAGKLGKPQEIAPKLLSTFSTALQGATKNLPALLIQSFTGGGNIKGALQAVGTDFGEKLFGKSGAFVKFTEKATDSLSKVFGKTIGGALGAAIPGIGALIGPAITGLGKLFGKIFQTEGKKTNDIRDAFQASFGPHGVGGTLEDLVKGFSRVGLGLSKVQQLLKAGNQKDFQKIVDEFNAATATQKTAFDKLNEATQKWGLSLADLGPQFRAQKIAESADSLYQDFKLLQASGADTATILQHMSGVVVSTAEDGSKAVTDWGEGFGNLIHQAMATGTALPKELEPVVQQMIDLGLIVRDDGTKFGSLEETGLSFAGSLSDIIKDDLVPTLKDLAIAIKQGLKIPLSEADQEYLNLRDHLQKPIIVPPVTVDVNYNTTTTGTPPPGGPGPGFGMPGSEDNPNRVWTGGKVLEAGIQHFLGGGRVLQFRSAGSDTVPAMLTPGELVLTASQQRAVGALLEMAPAYQPQAAVDTSQLRATGTDGAIHNHITIHGIDGPSITRVVKSREFADALATQTKHQKYGINRKLKRSTP